MVVALECCCRHPAARRSSSPILSSGTLPRMTIAPLGFADHVGRGTAVLFADFADDFLDKIFDRDDSRHQAVFVNHDGHLLILALHFLQAARSQISFRARIARGA